MRLTHLSLTNFRLFPHLSLEFPPGISVLVGNNAQGKTSLLEAVYYLSTFTSFHASSDRQLVNLLATHEPLAVARLVAGFTRADGAHQMTCAVIQEPFGTGTRMRREITYDGVKLSTPQALGNFNAVIFLPQMMRIIEGGPEDRRRYLNLAISQAVPGYAVALTEYQQVLTQRNALLKQLNERGGNRSQLDHWDRLLAERGALLIHARIRVVEELERWAMQIHDHLSRHAEVLRLAYVPSYDPASVNHDQMALKMATPVQRTHLSREDIQAGFEDRLGKARADDLLRGVTTLGPHRDDLRFTANSRSLGEFGSRGQVRTALLSVKMAEVKWLTERKGEAPILLLDETLAELDPVRREDLLEFLNGDTQSLLTTTDLTQFSAGFVDRAAIWHVDNLSVHR
jgi:DNA replication and repair protein RecF